MAMKVTDFESVHLNVPVLGAVSPACGSLMLQELVKHYLYMRCQIPNVYDEIYRQLQVPYSRKAKILRDLQATLPQQR